MSSAIDFYFDFSSPFGYLCSERIESVAQRHGRAIVWHPILLGAVFKVSGQRPLVDSPLKGEYSLMDIRRAAREHDIPYVHPERFPISSVAACRSVCWLQEHPDNALRRQTVDWIHTLFRAFYTDGRAIDAPDTLQALASENGLDASAMAQALAEPSIKQRLHEEVDAAIARGVFGSPTLIVDDEMFWGNDRLEQLDRWLARGGW